MVCCFVKCLVYILGIQYKELKMWVVVVYHVRRCKNITVHKNKNIFIFPSITIKQK